jgi:hypothetical protein
LLLLLLSLPLGRSAAATEEALKFREQSCQLRTVLLGEGSNLEERPHVEAGSLNLLTELGCSLEVLRLNLWESLYVLGRELGSLLPLLLRLLLPRLLSSLLLLLGGLLLSLLLSCLLLLSLGVGVLLRRSRTLPRLCALTGLGSRIGLTCLWSLLSHLSILPFE